MLSVVKSWLIGAVHSGAAWLHDACKMLWDAFCAHPTPVLIAIGLALGAGLLLLTLLLRAIAPKWTVVVSDFEVPRECISKLGVTGTSLAALLADEMLGIVKVAVGGEQNFDSSLVETGSLSLLPIGLTGLLQRSTAPQIEVKGISWGRLVWEWKGVRERQIAVSGDVIAGPERTVLAARVPGKWSWKTEPFAQTEVALTEAVKTLAKLALRDIYPRMSGMHELAEGRTEEGIRLLQQSLLRRPKDVFAVEQLSALFGKQKRTDDALALLHKFTIPWYRRYDRAVLYKSFMAAYFCKGDLNKALDYARRAARLAPREALLQRNLALTSAKLGIRKDALRACRKAQELAPGHPALVDLEAEVRASLAKELVRSRVEEFLNDPKKKEGLMSFVHGDGAAPTEGRDGSPEAQRSPEDID